MNSHRAIRRLFIALLVGSNTASPAFADSFCVDTPAELQAALDASETNGEIDLIQIVGGTYARTGGFAFQSTEPHLVVIVGGYSTNCTNAKGPQTIIDGENVRRGLWVLHPNGDIRVENITFIRGLSTNNRGGGLRAQSDSGDITVDRNIFYGNHADDFAGAANIVTESGTLRVRGNLAFANSAANIGAFELTQVSGFAYVGSNTITANDSEGDFLPGGLWIGGGANFEVSNNIIWDNLPDDPGPFQSDFLATTPHTRYTNDIGVVGDGVEPQDVVVEYSVDPQFASCGGFLCFNFRLKRASPLVDAGLDLPGFLTTYDLDGNPRTIGPYVDIGAYENDLIFADGFD